MQLTIHTYRILYLPIPGKSLATRYENSRDEKNARTTVQRRTRDGLSRSSSFIFLSLFLYIIYIIFVYITVTCLLVAIVL